MINLIAVAQFQKSHGYERIIRSIHNYYSTGSSQYEVMLYMVGEGGEKKTYERLVKRYSLEDRVIFCGYRDRDELEELYDRADIALGCFGFYKRGISKSSALKTREYLLHGLPVISGCQEDIFRDNKDISFYMEVANDNSDIDFNEIVEFYRRIYEGKTVNEIRSMIREFAYNTIDVSITFKPVIEYLSGTIKEN